MAVKSYSHEYVLGIRDGREYLKRFKPSLFDMRDIVRNIEETMQTFNAGPVKEHLKGERDFWRNQIKKALGK